MFSSPWESATNDESYKRRIGDEQGSGETTDEQRPINNNNEDEDNDDYDDYFHRNGGNGNGSSSQALMIREVRTRRRQQQQEDFDDPEPHDSSYFCCSLWSYCSLPLLLQVLDMSWMVCLTAYAMLLYHGLHTKSSSSSSSAVTELLTVVFLLTDVVLIVALVVRTLWTTTWCKTNCSHRRCGTSWVTSVTLLLCGLYGALSLTSWLVILVKSNGKSDGTTYPWCNNSTWCNETMPKAVVPCIMTALFVLELLRTIFAQGQLAQYDQDHPQLARTAAEATTVAGTNSPNEHSSHRFRHRPWWWSRNSTRYYNNDDDNTDLEHPLLHGRPGWTSHGVRGVDSGDDHGGGGGGATDYSIDDGIVGGNPVTATTNTTRRGGGGMFDSFFGSRQSQRQQNQQQRRYNTNDHVREDGSVDYASLNEDWASRAEDDPYWWTRS